MRTLIHSIFQKGLLLFIFCLMTEMLYAQWRFGPTSNLNINDIFNVNASLAYEVGNNGYMTRTTDGGASWHALASGVTTNLNCTHFISASEGYAGGTAMIKTLDSGATWITLNTGISGVIQGMFFVNSSTGWVCTDLGNIYTTRDGGTTWILQSAYGSNMSSIYFTSPTDGWVVGASKTVLRTTDGGITWTPLNIITTSGTSLLCVKFVSATTGWITTGDGYVYRTTDAGATWSPVYIQFTSVYDLSVLSASLVYAGTANGVFKTTDGGVSWTTAGMTGLTIQDLAFYSATNGTSVVPAGWNPFTTDGGLTWTNLTVTTNTNSHGYNLFFTDDNNGWCVGNNGMVRKTTNGGNTWTSPISVGSLNVIAVYFSSAMNGCVAGASGNIRRTTDGGATWSVPSSGTTNILYGMHFTSTSDGIIVGDFGRILKTIDGGATWSNVSSGVTTTLRFVHFVSPSTGWIAGANGVILKTTDGGATWSAQTSGTTTNLYAVHFLNSTTGYVVGANGTILKTTNGGTTWTAQTSGVTDILTTLYFTSTTDGWAMGSAGVMLHTGDGGLTWQSQPRLSTLQTINRVFFTSPTNAIAAVSAGYIYQYKIKCTPAAPVNYTTSGSSICTGTSAILRAGGTGKLGWYNAPTGGTYLGSGSSFTTSVLSSNATFYVQDSTCSPSDSRTAVSVNVSAVPTITSSTPASSCGDGAVTLGAMASAGVVNWYSAAIGGFPLLTGNSYTTPVLTGSRNYYAEALNGGCKSASRTAVLATINIIPYVSSSTHGYTCGPGSTTLEAFSSIGTIDWYAASSGGSALGTGHLFTTPSVSSNTTYYAEANNSGCLSTSRTAVNAIVNTTYPSVATSLSGNTVTATQTGAGVSYQWLDCNNANAAIPGEVLQTFTPASTGSYAVEVTLNGCTDTSSCGTVTITDIEDYIEEDIRIFPNPASDKIMIGNTNSGNMHIKITDVSGLRIMEENISGSSGILDISKILNGMYFLEMDCDGKYFRKKIIKQ